MSTELLSWTGFCTRLRAGLSFSSDNFSKGSASKGALSEKRGRQPEKKKVWNGANRLLSDIIGLLSSKNFATMETWRNDFSSP